MNKRGASLVIAWVLLLGLSISLAIGVFSWSKLKTEALTESSVTFVEGSLECNEVKISIKKVGECDSLDVYNRGKLSIEKLGLSSLDGSSSEVLDANLVPLQNKVFDYSGPNTEEGIEVLPLIRVGDDLVACRNSKVLLDCLVLITIVTPFEGTPLSNTIEITADVSEEEGVSVLTPSGMIVARAIDLITGEAVSEIEKVEFKVDGIIIGSPVTQAPYSIQWDTTKFSNGEHEITAVVTYKSGNKESSAPVKVTVDNVVVSEPGPSPTTGNTYYVATTGNDANPGTISQPFKTIQKAADLVKPGDTIYVRGGIYQEGVKLHISGTSSALITLRNYPGEKPNIMGVSVDGRGQALPVSWNVIEGFEIRNNPAGTEAIYLVNAQDLIIRDNYVHNAKRQGLLSVGAFRVLIDRNIFANNGDFAGCAANPNMCNLDHGLYATGDYYTITNNLFYGNLAYGIQMAGYPLGTYPGTFSQDFAGASHWVIANNVFAYQQNRGGIVVWQKEATDSRIENNIFYENAVKNAESNTQGIDFYGSGGGHIVKNNIFYSSKGRGAISDTKSYGPSYMESGRIEADPKFVSPSTNDFHLQSTSPAIDKGVTLSEVTKDFDGKTRPIGSAWDIGAYEYGTGTSTTTTTGVKAFPTAEGFGANTVGGRGGRVIEVTNLNDAGPGSFRDCAVATGPRTCVFKVGGTIVLKSRISIQAANSYLTIAGQTAPGDGIAITPWPISISYGAHDVIVRYIRLRQGFDVAPPDENNDCGNLAVWAPSTDPVYNVIIDHVSAAWACDDSIQGFGAVSKITFQWMLVGEGYFANIDGFGNSKGYILGGMSGAKDTISAHHNVIIHSAQRNPNVAIIGTLDWRNNLVYNWWACTGNMALGGTDDRVQTTLPSNTNFVGNKYIPGTNSNTLECWLGELWTDSITKIYQYDNDAPFCNGPCAPDAWDIGWGRCTRNSDGSDTCIKPASEATFRVYTPFSAPAITYTPVSQLESLLSVKAGAIKPKRDSLDARFINELQTRTGSMGRQGAPFPVLNGGVAYIDTDKDGMPDSWESSHFGLNLNDASDGAKVSSNGYTNVENYLNELAGDPVPGFT